MSKISFEKNFKNPLLKKLDQEARKSVQRQKGQLLILADTTDLKSVIEMVIPNITIQESDLKEALKAAQSHAKKLHASFKSRNVRRYNAIVSKLPQINLPHKLGVDMFIVSSFSKSIDTIKTTMLKVLLDKGVFSEQEQKDISRNLHKGHGARGTAVSQVQIAKSVSHLDDVTKKLLLHNLSAAQARGDLSYIEHREIEKLTINSRQIVTKAGKLTADYVSVISFQAGPDNIKDSEAEKSLKKSFRDFVNNMAPELITMQNSSSLHQKIEKAVVAQFTDKKNLKVITKTKNTKLSTSNKVTSNLKSKKSKVGLKKGTPRQGRRKQNSGSAASQPLMLLALINKELPSTVRKNMDLPALENRTGRFSESVRITDITQTPQGFPSIGYTYDKFPYQTFEPGYAQGSYNRDPRRLIDKSIREIAAQFAIGRFYTRRT